MVISSEGYFYSYSIDLENGGECLLMKQYRYVHPHLEHHIPCAHVSCTASLILGMIRRRTRIEARIDQDWRVVHDHDFGVGLSGCSIDICISSIIITFGLGTTSDTDG